MTVISLERRLRKIEEARLRPDDAIKALSDGELAACLREASDDPRDHAIADWFAAGCDETLSADALEYLKRDALR